MNLEDKKLLIKTAMEARENAYVPYSGFTVGAALLTKEGKIYKGCNIECASYGGTNCAERTAIFKAVSEGERRFEAIAIVGGMQDNEATEYAYPCGICRQVLKEFVADDFCVIVAKNEQDYKEYLFTELLPFGFGGDSIK